MGDSIYIQPDDNECPAAEKVCEFARGIGAIPAYAYLGDVAESPTGDKKAEKFEDGYIEELFPLLRELGYLAVTYMPPRNTKAQLARVHALCEKYGFMEISGVDINSPRQKFNCPEVMDAAYSHLLDTTWALAAHEALSSQNKNEGLFCAENPLAKKSLAERIRIYAERGRIG